MQITEVLIFLAHVHCTVNFVLHPDGGTLNYLSYAAESTMLLLNNWHNYGKWDCALPIYSPNMLMRCTFSVDMYDPQIRKLDQPVDLESFF